MILRKHGHILMSYWGGERRICFPSEMFHEGTSLVTSKGKAEGFNNYFIGLPVKAKV